jgi:hypothetical protein
VPKIGIGRIAAAFLLAVAIFAPRAQAMEGMSGMYNTCMLMAGMHELHLSAYQTSSGSEEEFCADVPSTGPTIITINAVSPEILKMTTEIRIVRDDGSGELPSGDLAPITIAHLPPKNYPTGIATLPVNFDKAGDYLVLVTVDDGNGMSMTSRFVISAGKIFTKSLFVWVVYGGILLAVLGIFLWIERRRHRMKIKPT